MSIFTKLSSPSVPRFPFNRHLHYFRAARKKSAPRGKTSPVTSTITRGAGSQFFSAPLQSSVKYINHRHEGPPVRQPCTIHNSELRTRARARASLCSTFNSLYARRVLLRCRPRQLLAELKSSFCHAFGCVCVCVCRCGFGSLEREI